MKDGNIYRSYIPDIKVPKDLSIHQYLTAFNPDDAPAQKVIWEDLESPKKTMTYGGLREAASLAAGGLASKYGLKEGDSVAIIGSNSVDWALAAHASIWLGAIAVGVNHLATSYELKHYLELADPSIAIVEASSRTKVQQVLSSIFPDRNIPILILGGNDAHIAFPDCVMVQEQPIPPLNLNGRNSHDVPACVLFSSGTTGKPKAVHLSHYNVLANLLTYRAGAPHFNNVSMVEVFFPPFAHMLGLMTAVLGAAFFGNYVLIMKQYEFRKWIRSCAEKRATLMKIVPSIAMSIAKDPEVPKLDLTSLQYIVCTGAPLHYEIVNILVELMNGVHIVQGYGMSEGTVSRLHPVQATLKAGSVGTLFPSVSLRLVDDNMKDVSVGTPGEALIKAPTVFMHYRKNEEATKNAFHDGWLRTGDSLIIDRDGHLWFQDRKKDMIKYKGLQIAPSELEDILTSYSDVVEAAVTATWDATQETEIPVGYVVLSPSIEEEQQHKVLENIVKDFNTKVSSYKKLRGGLYSVKSLPKNATGKIMRSLLPARTASTPCGVFVGLSPKL
ncbi:hypothetical protein H2204_002199 [Knufia peltigerae]|uniref:Uncharacterized protein n=1 Tax=Knufia peltigerae TaxID=1002370 RepID=A0AA38YBW6_9EURO|nr:hypothetical protein H2204_002199 [Knufia peltigerae]